MCTDELLRYVLLSAKVPGRVEGKGWDRCATIGIVSRRRVSAADGEEGPSRRVPCVGDAVCGCFEKVELVERRAVDAAGQDGEELEEEASSDKYQRAKGKNGSWVEC